MVNLNYVYARNFMQNTFGRISMSIEESLFREIEAFVKPGMTTLEFGCGLSTFAFGQSFMHRAIEQSEAHAKCFSTAIYCPLTPEGWYMWEPPPYKFDAVLIDGPYLGDRGKALEVVPKLMTDAGRIWVDDVHRYKEQNLAQDLRFQLSWSIRFTDRYAVIYPGD